MLTLKRKKRTFRFLFTVILIFLCFPLPARADGNSGKKIRVGYYENEVFEEGASEGAVKRGYAYEYYRKLSEYTGWEYEYIYGSFTELYDMLLNGQIDLLAGLAWTESRKDIIGYPELAMGNEIYTLMKHNTDEQISSDPATLTGKKIGVLNSAISGILQNYLDEHGVKADVMEFDDYETLFAAFDDNKISVLAAEGDGAYGRAHSELICTFGISDYYLCVSCAAPGLLSELNAAQSQLAAEEPNYISTLRSKYYSSSVSSLSFSSDELEWITGHTALTIGYLNSYLPYSDTDVDGNATGMVTDIASEIVRRLDITGIEVVYRGYRNYDEMIEAVTSGVIDAAFPVGGGLYYSEENGIYQSAAIVSATTDLVYKGVYNDQVNTHFAVNENNRMQYYYIKSHFPDAKISLYASIDDCLEAVLAGEVTATTLNGLRANDILRNSRYKGLYLKQLGAMDDRSFGIKIGNEGLLRLVNHGIKVLGEDYAQNIAYRYAGNLYSYTLPDMIRDYIWLFLAFVLLLAMLAIYMIVRDLKRTRRADRLKSDFVSNMSHEIRTPITAILGMNHLITQESDNETILEYSANIERAGESLLGIINDILDFSRIEAGRIDLLHQDYSLPELLLGLYAMIEIKAREKGLHFEMKVDGQLPRGLRGDNQKLLQVITNLLTNAVKYTEQGSVTCEVSLVSASDSDIRMKVSVSDTGIGIRDEERDKLFSAFDRLDLGRTGNIEGSGLGLAISERMLKYMGSEMKLESVYGQGSCFYFEIRQEVSDPTPMGDFEACRSAGVGKDKRRRSAAFTAPAARVLIVDDTPVNLQVVSGLLKQYRIRTDTAASGMDCIAKLETEDFDLIFLDQRMPEMDGGKTLGALMKLYPEKMKHTPVVSLTANAMSGARDQMIKAGFSDYLVKPVNVTQLEDILLKFIPGEKLIMAGPDQPGETLTVTEPDKTGESRPAPALTDRASGISGRDDPAGSPEIPDALKKIGLLDIEKGLAYCGDMEDYIDALAIYRESVGKKAGELLALSESDPEAFSLLVHSLKSSSAAIGAVTLSELAKELEHLSGKEDPAWIREKTLEFIKLYQSLGDELDRFFKS